MLGTGLTNVFPSRPDLNWSLKSGLNGRNFIGRIDHQINGNNTYTFRYLTERQPNRNLLYRRYGHVDQRQLRAGHRPDGERGL